jgi:hypothetical protein
MRCHVLSIPISAAWRLTYGGVLALIAALALLHWRRLGGPAFPIDDAYIVLSNVRALTEGAPNFPGAPPITGATSLLHTLAAVPFALLLGPEAGLWTLTWLGVAAAATGAVAMGRAVGLSPTWAVALAAASLCTGQSAGVLLNGLETGWALAALFWTFRCVAHDPLSRVGAVLCGLLPWVRPELGVFSAALMIGAAADWRTRGGDVLRAAALCLGPALALLAVHQALAGMPLPRTGEAKRLFFGVAALPIWVQVATFVSRLAEFLAGTGALWVGALLTGGRAQRHAMRAALALLLLVATLYGGIAYQNSDRLMWDFVPPIAFALGAAAAGAGWHGKVARGALAVSVALNVWAAAGRVDLDMTRSESGRRYNEERATWVRANLDPSQPLMVHDIGHLSWATDQRLVDMVGLKTPRSIDTLWRATATKGIAGIPDALDEIARAGEVCTLLVSSDWNRRMRFADGLRDMGWGVVDISGDIRAGIEVFRLTPPEGPFPICAPR